MKFKFVNYGEILFAILLNNQGNKHKWKQHAYPTLKIELTHIEFGFPCFIIKRIFVLSDKIALVAFTTVKSHCQIWWMCTKSVYIAVFSFYTAGNTVACERLQILNKETRKKYLTSPTNMATFARS